MSATFEAVYRKKLGKHRSRTKTRFVCARNFDKALAKAAKVTPEGFKLKSVAELRMGWSV